jgi:hypothetical protein
VGISDMLMGYRESGPERDIVMMRYAGRCYFCNHKVYVVPSGFEILGGDDFDAKMVCNICWNDPDNDLDRTMGDY